MDHSFVNHFLSIIVLPIDRLLISMPVMVCDLIFYGSTVSGIDSIASVLSRPDRQWIKFPSIIFLSLSLRQGGLIVDPSSRFDRPSIVLKWTDRQTLLALAVLHIHGSRWRLEGVSQSFYETSFCPESLRLLRKIPCRASVGLTSIAACDQHQLSLLLWYHVGCSKRSHPLIGWRQLFQTQRSCTSGSSRILSDSKC